MPKFWETKELTENNQTRESADGQFFLWVGMGTVRAEMLRL